MLKALGFNYLESKVLSSLCVSNTNLHPYNGVDKSATWTNLAIKFNPDALVGRSGKVGGALLLLGSLLFFFTGGSRGKGGAGVTPF